jgi:hypothetical protein
LRKKRSLQVFMGCFVSRCVAGKIHPFSMKYAAACYRTTFAFARRHYFNTAMAI